jgi:hypothetical protein
MPIQQESENWEAEVRQGAFSKHIQLIRQEVDNFFLPAQCNYTAAYLSYVFVGNTDEATYMYRISRRSGVGFYAHVFEAFNFFSFLRQASIGREALYAGPLCYESGVPAETIADTLGR